MKAEQAMNQIQNIVDRSKRINQGVHFTDKDIEALNIAINLLKDKVELTGIISDMINEVKGESE
jgi:hypothetical protein